jgi:hypothetical protein
MDESEDFWAQAGALSSENWKAALRGAPLGDAFEYPLFTDASLEGEIANFGPYEVLNALVDDANRDTRTPAAFLRVNYQLDAPLRDSAVTYDKLWHGGQIEDEITALLSLALGIRLKAGAATRVFYANRDPKGRPWGFKNFGGEDPVFVSSSFGPLLPSATGLHQLRLPDEVARFHEIGKTDSVALVRSARLYQNAVWVAEADPSQAWLLLVSAIETAAWENDTPLTDLLRDWMPDLAEILLEVGGPDHLSRVAQRLGKKTMGATKRFRDFVLYFLPEPPPVRPREYAQHDWTRPAIKKSLNSIYGHRSNALHGGKPFPAPMCWPPRSDGEAFYEKPAAGGTAAGRGDNMWAAQDLPMHLHTFEYIVRRALLGWWRSLLQLPESERGKVEGWANESP